MSAGATTLRREAGPPVPPAALLAAWGSAWLAGRAAADDVLAAVGTGIDRVEVHTGPDQIADGLLELLATWRRAGTTVLGVALPRPGQVADQPGPAQLVQQALAAGQCVYALDGVPRWAAVPHVSQHGNAFEGHALTVRWRVSECDPAPPPTTQVSEADQALKTELLAATRALAELDVARWRPELAAQFAGLRAGRGSELTLPPGWPPRAARLLGDARRLQVVLELALSDDGAAVTGSEMQRRRDALAGLDRAVHEARVAAWNAHAEPARLP